MAISRRSDGTIGNCCCGNCPAPDCANCSTPSVCPPSVSLSGENLQLNTEWDISTDSWPSTSYSDSGGCIDFSIFNSFDDDFYIINFTSGANFKSQLESLLSASYGGTWTVAINVSGSNFTVTDISAINTNFNIEIGTPEFIFATCAGVDQSNHFVSGTIVDNCAKLLADHPLFQSGGVEVEPDGACKYTYTEDLEGVCNLKLEVTANLNFSNITVVALLRDNGGTIVSGATYISGALVSPYPCDDDFALTLAVFNNGGLVNWSDTSASFLGL